MSLDFYHKVGGGHLIESHFYLFDVFEFSENSDLLKCIKSDLNHKRPTAKASVTCDYQPSTLFLHVK